MGLGVQESVFGQGELEVWNVVDWMSNDDWFLQYGGLKQLQMINIDDIVDFQLWWKIQFVSIFSNFVKDGIRAISYWQKLVMLAFEALLIQV